MRLTYKIENYTTNYGKPAITWHIENCHMGFLDFTSLFWQSTLAKDDLEKSLRSFADAVNNRTVNSLFRKQSTADKLYKHLCLCRDGIVDCKSLRAVARAKDILARGMSENNINDESRCRVCGCSLFFTEVFPGGITCYGIHPGPCSACAEKIREGKYENLGRITEKELTTLRATRTRSDAKEFLMQYFGVTGNYEVGDTVVRTNVPVVAGDMLRLPTKTGYFYYLALADGQEMTMADVLYPTI